MNSPADPNLKRCRVPLDEQQRKNRNRWPNAIRSLQSESISLKKKLKINNGYYNSWGCLFKVDELPNTCDIMQTYQMTSTKGKWIERCKLVNNALASSKLQTADLGRKGSQTFYAREGNRILRFLSTFSWKDLHKINNVIESLRARSTTRINFRLGPN